MILRDKPDRCCILSFRIDQRRPVILTVGENELFLSGPMFEFGSRKGADRFIRYLAPILEADGVRFVPQRELYLLRVLPKTHRRVCNRAGRNESKACLRAAKYKHVAAGVG